ncbi:MAG: DUF3180 domain-containing protein [Actinomycetota bacterium]|nr:DUF3180 domain-containing protein [Actinomycetota bacterium]
MRPTRPAVLVLVAVVLAVVGYLVVRSAYRDLPPLPRYAPASLLVAALGEAVTASSVRARLAGRSRTKPIDPLVVARMAALAKASSLVGAAAFGLYGAVFAYTLGERDRVAAAGADAVVSAFGTVGGLVLVVAALRLERACRHRDRPPPSAESGG